MELHLIHQLGKHACTCGETASRLMRCAKCRAVIARCGACGANMLRVRDEHRCS